MQYISKMDAKVDQIVQTQQAIIQNLERQVGQDGFRAWKGKIAKHIRSQSEREGKVMSGQELDKQTSVGEKPKEKETLGQKNGEKSMVEQPNHKKEDEEEEVQSKEISSTPKNEVKPYVPPIPFPQRLKARKVDDNFPKFLEVFKKI